MFRKLTRTIAAMASLAVIGLFAVPQVAHQARRSSHSPAT